MLLVARKPMMVLITAEMMFSVEMVISINPGND